ncbi:DUF979 domain-containing protein [Pseudolactococcus yaeyamensis]
MSPKLVEHLTAQAPNVLEFFYILVGLLIIVTAVRVFLEKSNSARLGTSVFWLLLGIVFAFGGRIPKEVDGALLLIMGLLTLFKQVKLGKVAIVDEKVSGTSAQKIGGLIFIPCISLAFFAVVVAQVAPFGPASGQIGIGIAAILSLLVAIILTKASVKTVFGDTDRMLQQVGVTGILPQLLAALGVVFTAAGVGDVISKAISGFVPEGNRLVGVIAYVLGMVIFTMIMGNGFAAFTVITAGIGVPFVIAQGADPVIAGALAMTAGFCGTLLTPMAANFNALPVALLEMKDENGVIKAQAPIAFVMIVVHIVLMYVWAF